MFGLNIWLNETMSTPETRSTVQSLCALSDSLLGPLGATKLIIQPNGEVTATASIREVYDRLELSSPALSVLLQAVEDFDNQHGDGIKTMLSLSAGLLRQANRMQDYGVHPSSIVSGYQDSMMTAAEFIDERARPRGNFSYASIAETALTGIQTPHTRRYIAKKIAHIVEHHGAESPSTTEIVVKPGGSVAETEVLDGVIIDKGPVVANMPRDAEGAIGLLTEAIDVPHAGSQLSRVSKYMTTQVNSFTEHNALAEKERAGFRELLKQLDELDIVALLTVSSVNERVKSLLVEHGYLSIHRVDRPVLDRIARLTGAQVTVGIQHLQPDNISQAHVSIVRLGGEDITVVKSAGGTSERTLLCRAPDIRSATAFEHSVRSALAATAAADASGTILPGGGVTELQIGTELNKRARGVDDRRQIAMEGFANAMFEHVGNLAKAAGLDPTDAVLRLKNAHARGSHSMGINVLSGEIEDVLTAEPILDAPSVKKGAIIAATEFANQQIRIDAELAATDLSKDNIDPPESIDLPEDE